MPVLLREGEIGDMSFRSAQWPATDDPELQARAAKRINVGCGAFPLPYYTNIDADPRISHADIYATVPPLAYEDGSLEEIYAGHFLEHLERPKAAEFLAECFRCLEPGGVLGIMVPDTREIMRRYLEGPHDYVQASPVDWFNVGDLDDLCHWVIFSTFQASPHRWAYDRDTLARAITRAGFEITGEINRWRDRRVAFPAWYQIAVEAKKP